VNFALKIRAGFELGFADDFDGGCFWRRFALGEFDFAGGAGTEGSAKAPVTDAVRLGHDRWKFGTVIGMIEN
jgi:hypothetical protein